MICIEFKINVTIKFDPSEKVWRSLCEEFPEIHIQPALNKKQLIENIYHEVQNELCPTILSGAAPFVITLSRKD